jgi:hypothetical protein
MRMSKSIVCEIETKHYKEGKMRRREKGRERETDRQRQSERPRIRSDTWEMIDAILKKDAVLWNSFPHNPRSAAPIEVLNSRDLLCDSSLHLRFQSHPLSRIVELQ